MKLLVGDLYRHKIDGVIMKIISDNEISHAIIVDIGAWSWATVNTEVAIKGNWFDQYWENITKNKHFDSLYHKLL